MTSLIEKIKTHCSNPIVASESADEQMPARVFPVATHNDVDSLEIDLRFRIPAFYRDLLTTVGNGGFGPGYGLAGTKAGSKPEGHYLAELYQEYRKPIEDDPHWNWPEKLLPASHLGCGMYWCVDCNTPEGAIIWFEPNPHENGQPWDELFIPLTESMPEWFERWLDGDTFLEAAWNKAFPE